MKKGLLLLALCCAGSLAASAADRVKPIYSGTFVHPSEAENLYLYNTGAAQFLCDGNDWNTHASVGEKGILVAAQASGEVNTDEADIYVLRCYPASKGYWCSLFITAAEDGIQHVYTDGNEEKTDRYFCFEPVNDFTFRIYGAENNETFKHTEPFTNYYLAVDPDYVNAFSQQTTGTGVIYAAAADKDMNVWAWVTEEAYTTYQEQLRIFYHAEELHAMILQAQNWNIDLKDATAAYENLDLSYDELTAAIDDLKQRFLEYYHDNVKPSDAVELTSFIVNPGFEEGTEPWQNEAAVSSFKVANWDAMIDGSAFTGTQYLDIWNAKAVTGSIYQTLTGMPNGVYEVTAAAYSNADGGYIFAGDAKVPVQKGDVSEQNKGQDYSVATIVADGILRFGYLPLHESEFWSCIDNFRITYYGDGEDAYAYWVRQSIEGAPNFTGQRCQQALIDAYNQALSNLKNADTSQDVSAYITAFVEALNAVKANINAYDVLETTMNESQLKKTNLYDYYAAQMEQYISDVVQPALASYTLSTAEVTALQQQLLHIVDEGLRTFDLYNQLIDLMSQMEELINADTHVCAPAALTEAQQLDSQISQLIDEDAISTNEEYRTYIGQLQDAIQQLRIPVTPGTDNQPVDYSAYIINNGFEQGLDAWTHEGQISTYETATWALDQNYYTGTAYLNLWDAAPNGRVFQTIQGLPTATYTLSVSAFSNRANTMIIFAADDNVIVEGSENESGTRTYEVTTRVTDGTLTLGIILYGDSEAWCMADNFQLLSYGPDSHRPVTGNTAKDILPNGIEDIASQSVSNIVAYDITGRRIKPSQLKSGLYIIGGRKVFIR